MSKQLLRDLEGNPIGTIEPIIEFDRSRRPWVPMPRTDAEWSAWWLKGKENHVRPQEGVSLEAHSWAFSSRIDELRSE